MNSILEEIARQSKHAGMDNFVCSSCKFYAGKLACENNVFIAFEGADMRLCSFYRRGLKCPHCGRNH